MLNIEDTKEVFQGNGIATAFPFDFKTNAKAELSLVFASADGVERPLLLDTDYAVVLSNNQNTNPGGVVTYPIQPGVPPLADGERLAVLRAAPATQPTTFTFGVQPRTLEEKFDQMVMLVQQLKEQAQRAMHIGVTDAPAQLGLGTALQRASRLLGFDKHGDVSLAELIDGVPFTQDVFDRYLATAGDEAKEEFFAAIETTGSVAQALYSVVNPRTEPERLAEVTPVNYAFAPGDVRRYGAAGDGVANDQPAFVRAIAVSNAGGGQIAVPKPSNFYRFNTTITIDALTNDLCIAGEGRAEIRYMGNPSGYVILVWNTAGYQVDISSLAINANLNTPGCLRLTNPSTDMSAENASIVTVRDCEFKNGMMSSGQTMGACGFFANGGYERVLIENCYVRNMTRETGAGIPGSQGSTGLSVTGTSMAAYPKQLIVRGCTIELITNAELTATPADVDCDGIVSFAPTAGLFDGNHVPATAVIESTRFVNCKGRCVKTQLDGFSTVRDFTIVRDYEEAITNAREFDFQRGGGLISGGVVYYYTTPDNGTTLGVSHCLANFTVPPTGVDAGAYGGFFVSDVVVFNAIPAGTDTLPYGVLMTNTHTNKQTLGIEIRGVKFVGNAVGRVFRYSGGFGGGTAAGITVANVEGDVRVALVEFPGATSFGAMTRLVLTGNRNTNSLTIPLVSTTTTTQANISGHSNAGFFSPQTIYPSADNHHSAGLRTPYITGAVNGGHTLSAPMLATVPNEGTFTFPATGPHGVGFITNNFTAETQAIFQVTSPGCILLSGGSTVTVSTNGTNPDVAGDLNVWLDTDYCINIKNRLGSTRRFCLTFIGGN